MQFEPESEGEVESQKVHTLEEILLCLSNSPVRETRRQQQRRFSVYALVIDGTKPYYRSDDQTYASSVSVIDESLNQVNAPLHPYCSVTLISDTFEHASLFEIGSVLQLNRFSFEAQGKHLKAIPSLQGSQFQRFGWEERQQSHKSDRVQTLQRWFLSKIPQLYTPSLGIKARSANIVSLAPFSMLLAIRAVKDSQTMGLKQYELIDGYGNTFHFDIQPSKVFREGCQVIISRITHVDEMLRIQCNQLGSILAMPPGCQLKHKAYRALYNFAFKRQIPSNSRAEHPEDKQLTQLTTKSIDRCYSQHQLTYLTDLLEAMEIYRKGGSVELLSENSQPKHLVEVYPLRIRGQAKLYSTKDRLEVNFAHALRNKMLDFVGQLEYIYEVCFEVKDLSLSNRKDVMKVFLYSWDGQGKLFFPSIDLNHYNSRIQNYAEQKLQAAKDTEEINSKLQQVFKKLVEECGPTRLLKLIVEPMKSYRRVEYRIVDSQLSKHLFAFEPALIVKQQS